MVTNSKTAIVALKKESKKQAEVIEDLKEKLLDLRSKFRENGKIHIAFYEDEHDFYFKNNIFHSLHTQFGVELNYLPVKDDVIMLTVHDEMECNDEYVKNNLEEFKLRTYKVLEVIKMFIEIDVTDSIDNPIYFKILLKELEINIKLTRKVLVEKFNNKKDFRF